MSSVSQIRSAFLDFFAAEGHAVVPSSPLVPLNDPSLLFTNAGMVQFKNVFTGLEPRPYVRAATSQKCVRAGGKHNDLDNVGYTARHHTFFEMLGNFSFGDYFKDVAIEQAWRLLTREYGLPAEKLLVTVYVDDDQAFELWRKIAGLPEQRIIRIPTADNFWSMGDTGPCGPCSEIFYDHGPGIAGGPPGSPEEDGDRFIEVWNLVFMQYEQVTRERRIDLPRPSIDTGMGLERIAAVLQGKHDNYAIDLFQALIARTAELVGQPFEGARQPSFKVVADHLRSSAFLVADGVLPSNEGRGYVLRRIMRRGMRHAQLLGAAEPLLWRLVPALVREMGTAYPELARAEPLITEVLKLEETGFRRLLERGLRLLDDALVSLPEGAPLPGETAFKLYDTFGFPLDLTADALREQGRGVDQAGFDAAMAVQRAEARRHWKGAGGEALAPVWLELHERLGTTEFLGYAATRAEGRIVALLAGGQPIERAVPGQAIELLVNQTPFYAESGGQVGDTGTIVSGTARLAVTDTRKMAGDLVVHQATVEAGEVAIGDAVELCVDGGRRQRLRRAHSATHLVQAALRAQLGAHVGQRGSKVEPDRLRFDFSHTKPVTAAELAAVEAEVNAFLRADEPVSVRVMGRDEAIGSGAMALFGEKYGDEVRVVAMGRRPDDAPYSVELCGGTHVARTGEVALLRLVGEGGVASGVRRIEAVVGEAAYAMAAHDRLLLAEAAQLLKVSPEELPQRLALLQEERRKLEREVAELRRKLVTGAGPAEAAAIKTIGNVRFAGRVLDGVPAKELRGTADALRKELGSGVVALVGVNDGKAAVVILVSEDLAATVDAVALVRRGVEAVGGTGGGGRADFAQGGGPDGTNAAAALAAIEAGLAA